MTLMTEHEIRQAFASLRKLTAYSGPHGNQQCGFEEALVELARREARVPTALTRIDGFPAGGNGGGGASRNEAGQPASSTERATIALLDAEQRRSNHDEDGRDPVGERVVAALFTLALLSKGATKVRDRVTEAQQLSGQKKPRAHVAEDCCEEGCTKIAVTGDRSEFPGRCEAHRKALQRAAAKARAEGREEPRVIPREVLKRQAEIESGKGVHVDGPLAPDLDPVVERLVDDFFGEDQL